MLLNPCS